MIFKFKKFCSFILVVVLFVFAWPPGEGACSKIIGDCVFSVGAACRPAWWLRKCGKRFQASPFDWMGYYSLDTFVNCYKNKFSDFFENIELIPKKGRELNKSNAANKKKEDGDKFEHRKVRDTKNNILSIHHFKECLSLKDGQMEVREKMIKRGAKVDEIFHSSDTIIFLCDRQKESLKDFKNFINKFSALYPDKNITLINVRNGNSDKVQQKVLYDASAQMVYKESDNSKRNLKEERKKFKIIEYRFKNASPRNGSYKWEGNEKGWDYVINDIELTDKIFGKNVDLSKVEY